MRVSKRRAGGEEEVHMRIPSFTLIDPLSYSFSPIHLEANAFISSWPQYQIGGIKTTAPHISGLSIRQSRLIETLGHQ